MSLEFRRHASPAAIRDPAFREVCDLADELFVRVGSPACIRAFEKANQPGAHSREAQAVVWGEAEALGFASEKKGLFADCENRALRPDMFRRVGETGILLEVERGKTLKNNMDLLDFWKCHICSHAHYLFVFVPTMIERSNEKEKPFPQVVKRLGAFYEVGNETNVRAAFVFGY
ncbi:MAG: hypothetical protein K0V04_38435 [Deltaproteobacteria bacterium]|nr:hypothetical protein [Deltaproteobacteria bacterium]